MDVRRDANALIDQPSPGRLETGSLGAIRQTIADAVGEARDDRRLGQALQLDNRVVAALTQEFAELLPFGAHTGAPPSSAPAPKCALDDVVESIHLAQKWRTRRLDTQSLKTPGYV